MGWDIIETGGGKVLENQIANAEDLHRSRGLDPDFTPQASRPKWVRCISGPRDHGHNHVLTLANEASYATAHSQRLVVGMRRDHQCRHLALPSRGCPANAGGTLAPPTSSSSSNSSRIRSLPSPQRTTGPSLL